MDAHRLNVVEKLEMRVNILVGHNVSELTLLMVVMIRSGESKIPVYLY